MKQKKFWNKKNAIAIVIALLMVSSIIGLMWSQSPLPTTKYKGHVLTAKNNMWWIKVNSHEIGFNFHPSDVENITMDAAIKEKLLNTLMIYITFDPENPPKYIDSVRFEISSALQSKGIYVESSTIKESEDYALPVIDCSNATKFVPVVKFEPSEKNKTILILEDNCIIAQAKDDADIIKLKDRLLYSMFGII